MLRGCLVLVGVVGAAVGVVMIATGSAIPAAIELLATAVVVVLALLFERRGYRPDVNRAQGPWEETSERFVDPVSGHLMVVRYNPETGERDYVDRGTAE